MCQNGVWKKKKKGNTDSTDFISHHKCLPEKLQYPLWVTKYLTISPINYQHTSHLEEQMNLTIANNITLKICPTKMKSAISNRNYMQFLFYVKYLGVESLLGIHDYTDYS